MKVCVSFVLVFLFFAGSAWADGNTADKGALLKLIAKALSGYVIDPAEESPLENLDEESCADVDALRAYSTRVLNQNVSRAVDYEPGNPANRLVESDLKFLLESYSEICPSESP